MAEAVANLSTDFLFSRLRGRWGTFVRGPALRRLADGRGPDAMRRILQDRGVEPGDRQGVQKGLTRHLLTELHDIGRLADGRTAAFYRLFAERYHVENLKTLLHARFVSDAREELSYLLIRGPWVPAVDAKVLAAAPTVHRFYRGLPEHPLNEELLPVIAELEDSRDMLRAEARIDRLYFGRFSAAAQALPVSSRRPGTELVRMEIDISNLIMLLRNAAMYGLPAERMREFRIPGGSLADAVLPFEPGTETDLPGPYGKVLSRASGGELYQSENALWTLLWDVALRTFGDFNRPQRAIVAYPFLKRFEVLNLGRMYEGLRFSLVPADLVSMMVGGSDV
jgi:vacuolar-type H+-ATPase subunit C/Vma6